MGELQGAGSSCPVCKSPVGQVTLSFRGEWRLDRCNACGMVYLANPPAYDRLAGEFAWRPSYGEESRSRRAQEPVLHAIEDSLRPISDRLRPDRLRNLIRVFEVGGRILDLGCGRGRRLLERLPPNAVPFGIEIEPDPAQTADKAFAEHGGKVWCAPACDALREMADASMDSAVCHAYLEHEKEPIRVLDELARVLRPGAPVIIKVPNYASVNRRIRGRRWCGYRFPDHVNYFTPMTLKALVERCGFTVVRSRFIDHLPCSDNLWMVVRRHR